MGHVLFAAPSIRSYHLHERLARALRSRGHRVSVLCVDPVAFTFYSAQGMPAWRVALGKPWDSPAPVREFAADHCRLRGLRPGLVGLVEERLSRLAGPALRMMELDCPDLVVLHQERTGAHRLLHFLAREMGCVVLWTGGGLLPHTMQWDGEGLDGDSSVCRRTVRDFERVEEDDLLLAASLAALLGRTAPAPLARRMLARPTIAARLRDSICSVANGSAHGLLGAFTAWRQAAAPRTGDAPRDSDLPRRPFVAVLLQHPDDPRLRLDSASPPEPAALATAARRAASVVEPDMPVVAVLPEGGLPSGAVARLRRMSGVRMELARCGPEAVATAVVCVSVNHPLGIGGLLAGTPVLHLGRTPYGMSGVAFRTTLDGLPVDLPAAFADNGAVPRRRFLSWLLAHGHLWCDPDWPDQNGITGLVLEVEARLSRRGPEGQGLRYRAGPAWPLATGS